METLRKMREFFDTLLGLLVPVLLTLMALIVIGGMLVAVLVGTLTVRDAISSESGKAPSVAQPSVKLDCTQCSRTCTPMPAEGG